MKKPRKKQKKKLKFKIKNINFMSKLKSQKLLRGVVECLRYYFFKKFIL